MDFSGITYMLPGGEEPEQEWDMEGGYHAGTLPSRHGHPDSWDPGDPPEVEITFLTNTVSKERLPLHEFVSRFGISEKEQEVMSDQVTEHMDEQLPGDCGDDRDMDDLHDWWD